MAEGWGLSKIQNAGAQRRCAASGVLVVAYPSLPGLFFTSSASSFRTGNFMPVVVDVVVVAVCPTADGLLFRRCRPVSKSFLDVVEHVACS